MSALFQALMIISGTIAILSLINMKLYLSKHGKAIPWGGIYFFWLFLDYIEISKKKESRIGKWFYIFLISMMLAFSCGVSMIIM
jgi:hypothetical protein